MTYPSSCGRFLSIIWHEYRVHTFVKTRNSNRTGIMKENICGRLLTTYVFWQHCPAACKTCKAVTLTLLNERHREALSQRTVTEHNHWTAKQKENRVPWKQKTIDRYWSHIYVTKMRLLVHSFELVKYLNHENSRHDSPVSFYVFHIKNKIYQNVTTLFDGSHSSL